MGSCGINTQHSTRALNPADLSLKRKPAWAQSHELRLLPYTGLAVCVSLLHPLVSANYQNEALYVGPGSWVSFACDTEFLFAPLLLLPSNPSQCQWLHASRFNLRIHNLLWLYPLDLWLCPLDKWTKVTPPFPLCSHTWYDLYLFPLVFNSQNVTLFLHIQSMTMYVLHSFSHYITKSDCMSIPYCPDTVTLLTTSLQAMNQIMTQQMTTPCIAPGSCPEHFHAIPFWQTNEGYWFENSLNRFWGSRAWFPFDFLLSFFSFFGTSRSPRVRLAPFGARKEHDQRLLPRAIIWREVYARWRATKALPKTARDLPSLASQISLNF